MMASKEQLRQCLAAADVDRLARMEQIIILLTELEAHRMALAHLCRVYIVSDEAWDQDADTIKAVERELNRFRPAATPADPASPAA